MSDPTPPSIPTGLVVGTVTATTAVLSWSAASDNVGVTGYEVQIMQAAGSGSVAPLAPSTSLAPSSSLAPQG